MNLIMASNPPVGGVKVQLRQEVLEDRRRRACTAAWKKFRRRLAAGTRLTFVFLLGATVLVFLFNHVSDIQQSAQSKVKRMAVCVSESSQFRTIRQSTLNHEQEIDEIKP